ncbi:CsbD family protein [Solimonas marina]|uniref:CsbD family protein n=1 Tax=Solimonas marina TaxID=2714601 RepID=A0A970B7H5_9GAMM|nr:CsbD family protein [Solimonas marina]NKF23675.1 CsbD family protein [Solimonas marina]
MNSDTLKGQWKQLRAHAKAAWARLTDDEALRIEGRLLRFSGAFESRYGAIRDAAQCQVERLLTATRPPSWH